MTPEPQNGISSRYDVAVIGGGGSGLAAAVTAAEHGAEVVVLEKRRLLGGNSSKAEGFFACESPAQRRQSIDAPRDQAYKKALAYSHYKVDARIVRAFVDRSGDTVRWLEGMGLYFDWVAPFYPNQTPQVWHIIRGYGDVIIQALARQCGELGVDVRLQTRAGHLLVDESGDICGVSALYDGKEISLTAETVIIATGGFGGNRALLRKYCPQYSDNMLHQGMSAVRGDGIRMAFSAGAGERGLGVLQLLGPAPDPKNWALEAVSSEPNMVWVNSAGRRFIDEAVAFNEFEAANAILEQPGKVCYALFDGRIRDLIATEGVIKGSGQMFVPPATKFPELHSILQTQAVRNGAKIADNWREIARWIGVDATKLENTIREYNACCDKGQDSVFAKERRYLQALRTPPFYAIKCVVSYLGTVGGILVNEHMEVLDRQREPIPGLFAAGVDAGGWESDTYCVELAGSTFGFALNSGRIAGERAQEFATGRKH